MFKPLLASPVKPEEFSKLKFPMFISPKLDGIRAFVFNGVVVSRNMKPIPNAHVQKLFGGPNSPYEGLDGELIVGDSSGEGVFARTSSGVMSRDGEPDVLFYVFDDAGCDPNIPYEKRLEGIWRRTGLKHAVLVPQSTVNSVEELTIYEEDFVDRGYEGAMVRSVDGIYKHGRSSLKQGIILKIKRFSDSEAEIIGFDEQMHNGNEAEKDAFGRTKRSSVKENLTPMGTLGALKVRDLVTGVEFDIGTGYDAATRQYIWDHQDEFLGKVAKYKFFAVGVKDKPRFPVYLGIRDPQDMS